MPCASGARRTQAWRGLRRGASAGGHGAGGGAERGAAASGVCRVGASRLLGAGWHVPRRRRAWPWSRRHSACGRPGANWAPTIAPPGRAAPRRIAGDRRAGSEHAHQRRAARRRRRADQRRGRDLAGRREQSVHRAAGGRVMARDAVFELRHTDGSVCVTCLSGVVEVALASGGATWRRSGWSMTRRACSPPRALDADDLPAWRDGFLRLAGALAEVLDEINRYRSGRVILMAQRWPPGPSACGGACAAGHGHRADSRELPARRHRLARRRAAAGLTRLRRAAGERLSSARGASFSMWSDHKNRLLFPRRSV